LSERFGLWSILGVVLEFCLVVWGFWLKIAFILSVGVQIMFGLGCFWGFCDMILCDFGVFFLTMGFICS
jgi:hypothetical protein